jgi:rhodanese-related sulfurtransferase
MKGETAMIRKLWISVLMVVCFTVLTGNALAAWWTKEIDNEKFAVTFAREVERGAYKIVTAAELKVWIEQKKDMLIVDTNPEASYKKGHIPGAVHLEIQRPEITKLDDKLKNDLLKVLGPNKNSIIVFYCGFTECTRSHNGAMWATRLGYTNAYRQPGGIKAWSDAAYPMESVK